VDDVDPALGDVSGESCLVRERSDTAKRGNVVLAQWNAAFVEFLDETSLPPQTGEFQIEGKDRGASERHELSLGAAAQHVATTFSRRTRAVPSASGVRRFRHSTRRGRERTSS
jgi:hypothetical protein